MQCVKHYLKRTKGNTVDCKCGVINPGSNGEIKPQKYSQEIQSITYITQHGYVDISWNRLNKLQSKTRRWKKEKKILRSTGECPLP